MIRKPPPPRLIETVEGDPVDDWVSPSRQAPATPEPHLPAEQGQEK